jgi:hypothetical protein
MEVLKMKNYFLITVLAIFILAGCSSTKSTVEYDDVYYSKPNQPDVVETQTSDPDYYTDAEYTIEDYETGEYVAYEEEPYYSTTETVENPDGTTYITNNYYEGYGYGDYYDYSYADRINRFYSPYMGYSYYSPFYMGYYYNPWYWDYYYYRPSWYFSYSWGWGGCYWGYPYYSWYYPYNSYWYGYNTGYWNGYWDGYYGYDYYSYNNYYGHRPSRGGSNTPYTSRGDYSPQSSSNINYFERTTPQLAEITTPERSSTNTGSGTPGRTSTNTVNNKGNVSPGLSETNRVVVNNQDNKTNSDLQSQAGSRNSQPSSKGNSVVVNDRNGSVGDAKNTPQRNATTQPRYTYKKPDNTPANTDTRYQPGNTIGENKQTRPTQKYTKPTQETVRNNTQRSNTPDRNTQKYTRPQSNYNKSYNRPTQYNTNRSNTESSRSSNNYSTPSRSSNSNYSAPSRSTKSNYSTPKRSTNNYSTPSRSGSSRSSYSSPSRSGSSKSYSSPSRSSSSSGSGVRSSGSRSGGGRR